MRIPRIFQPAVLNTGMTLCLTHEASHYVKQVLRMRLQQRLAIFDGTGNEYCSEISNITGKVVTVLLQEKIINQTESPLKIILAQAISRGEKMDFTLQKAVELGVCAIVPLMTERVGIKLDAQREQNRLSH